MTDVPFYLDWAFWQGVAAFSALIISLAPTVKRLYKGEKLEIELHDSIHLSHTVGNPNVNFYIMLRNTGGISLRVNALSLTFKPRNGQPFQVVGKMYYPQLTDNKSVILTPFKIEPNSDWEHTVYFYNQFSRQEDQKYRQLTSNLRANLALMAAHSEGSTHPSRAEQIHVEPITKFFHDRFKWFDDEYEIEVSVATGGKLQTLTKSVRMTIFEAEATELKQYADQYDTGLGVISFDIQQQPGVFIQIISK